MNKTIEIKSEYNSLDKLYTFLKTASLFECSKEYDIWEQRTEANGQMEQCILIKKSGMHAVKLYFLKDGLVKVNHIIPSKLMHAYFGKSVKVRRSIFEIIAGKIKETVLAGSQQKAFEELVAVVNNASA